MPPEYFSELARKAARGSYDPGMREKFCQQMMNLTFTESSLFSFDHEDRPIITEDAEFEVIEPKKIEDNK